MNFKELTAWVEAHPGESVLIGGGSLIFILWILGYFSPSAAAPAQDPLAAAYYAAEAQQAVVAGQIQQTTLTTAAQTAQTGIQANAAVAINAAQTSAATTINGQNTDAAMNINQTLGNDALQATYSNNATALATTQSNNATASQINDSNNQTSKFAAYVNTILPSEIAFGGGDVGQNVPGVGTFTLGVGPTSDVPQPAPASVLSTQGFSANEIAAIQHWYYGIPIAGVTH